VGSATTVENLVAFIVREASLRRSELTYAESISIQSMIFSGALAISYLVYSGGSSSSEGM
jgi:hypothetical protein